jgi:hypothetical protein
MRAVPADISPAGQPLHMTRGLSHWQRLSAHKILDDKKKNARGTTWTTWTPDSNSFYGRARGVLPQMWRKRLFRCVYIKSLKLVSQVVPVDPQPAAQGFLACRRVCPAER